MRKKPPPQYFSAVAAFLEDKCLDFTDCGLGIFCKTSAQIIGTNHRYKNHRCKSSVQILRDFAKSRRIDVKTLQDFSDYIIDNQ